MAFHIVFIFYYHKEGSSNRMHRFLASSVFRPFFSRSFGAHYSTLSLPSLSVVKVNRLSKSNSWHEEPQGKYWENEFFLEPEVQENARRIRRVILNIKNRTIEDVVQALKSDETCCKIRLTSNLVDGLLCKFGDDWKSALGFFQWANLQSGYKHTTSSCNKLVDLLGKMKQMDQMLDFVKEVYKGDLVTLETIARVMRRLAGAGRWKDAIKVFDDLGSMGLEKNTEAMNLLLDTLCKEKKVDAAREMYFKLKAHIPPDAYTFNIFVNGWCNARKIDEAMWTIQEMKRHGFHPSVITYSTILQAHCNQFDFSKAYDLLDEMTADGCPPNVVTYTTIMHSLAKSCKFEEALHIVEKMKLSGCKPDTLFYNSLINILGHAGQLGKASQIFGVEMQANGISRNLSTYNTMISIFCSHYREQDALDVLKEMENSSCRPVLQTYFPLLKLYFKTRKIDDQLNILLNDIVNKHHLSLDLDAYTLLIHGFCSVGKVEWACHLFEEMISQEILPRMRTMKVLIYEAEQKNMDGIVDRIRSLMKQYDKSSQQSFDD